MADNVLLAFHPPGESPNIYQPNDDGELGHCGSSKLLLGPCFTMLIPTAANAGFENDSEMWNMYLDEVKEEDNRITDAWKDDANSLVTFVSHNLLGSLVHLGDKLQDRSFLRNCWRIHH